MCADCTLTFDSCKRRGEHGAYRFDLVLKTNEMILIRINPTVNCSKYKPSGCDGVIKRAHVSRSGEQQATASRSHR